MLYRCVAAIPNEGGGCIECFYEDNADGHRRAEAFARQYDRPGMGVYDCVSPLNDRRRSKDNVALIEGLHCDIDAYKIGRSKEEIVKRLEADFYKTGILSHINSSGRGIHAHFLFREPIEAGTPGAERAQDALKRMIAYLGADPQPGHFAALMRRPGTTNSREGGGPCKKLIDTGARCELSDIEEYLDLVSKNEEVLFPSPAPKTGGEKHATDHNSGPVDVEGRLAAMKYKAQDDAGVNDTIPSVIASLIWRGEHPDAIFDRVMGALRQMAGRDGIKWDWPKEERQTNSRITSCYHWLEAKHDHGTGVPMWLPMEFHEAWNSKLAVGKRPTMSRNKSGWHVRSYEEGGEKADGNGSAPPEDNRAPEQDNAPKAPFILRPFTLIDETRIPPREFLYGRHYQRRVVSCTAAPGGTGKSSLVMVEMVAMATGRNLLGDEVKERARVWYHNGEDNRAELERRLVAICKYYNIPQEELIGWFFMTSGNEVPLRVAESWNQVRLSINHGLIKCVTEQIGDNKIDAAALDPLVTLHGVKESDPGQMDGVLRIFGGIADTQNCGVDLSHHTRKLAIGTAGETITIDDVRGAKAITDAARVVRLLNYMSERDAAEAGLMEVERTGYFRVDRGKGNYSAPNKMAIWRRFENVDLANGDNVGVVVPWLYPGQDGKPSPEKTDAEHKAEHVFLEILRRLSLAGRFVHERGPHSAPAVFFKEREAKMAKVGKAALADAMRRLFDKGKIRLEEFSTGHRNRAAKIVEN